MTKIFKIPFATQGDKTVVPVEIQTDGSVSYTQGYGYDYERDQVTDPAAKDIEREKMNSLFHDITESIGEMQLQGFAKWSEAGKPYAIRSVVYHNNKVWQSKIENNNIEPIAGNAWAELKADITANEVGAYNKAEADKRFQPVGKYQAEGYSYTKAESDTKYQPKGNYAPAGNYANKGDSYTKAESDGKYQPKGSYAPVGNYVIRGECYTKTESDNKYQPKGSYVTINNIYPVGIVVWFAQNKNPNILFPGTKWKYIGENKTIRLANNNGNNVLSSGGRDSIILTTDNLPSHQHSFTATTSNFDYGKKTTDSSGNHSHRFIAPSGTVGTPNSNKVSANDCTGGSFVYNNANWISNDGNHTHTVVIGTHNHNVSGKTSNTGSGSTVNIMNAYIMLMGWYRIQ